MSEQPNQHSEGPQYSEPTPEELERYEAWMDDLPESELLGTRILPARESGPEIIVLEAVMAIFEETYSLEELHAITYLKPSADPKHPEPGDASLHPLREPARRALFPIVTKLNALEEETDISSEQHALLKERYRKLSRAVGVIDRNNNVDHTR